MIKSTSLCLYICSVCVFVIRKLMSYPWKEIIKQISKPLVYLECSSPTSIWLKAHSLSCISHRQVHNYSRNGPLCNNTPKNAQNFFSNMMKKKMSSMVSISADWNKIGLNTANFQLADNDTELYSRHCMFYLYRFSPQNSKMFSSHHHKAHKFVTQNLLYIIRLKKKRKNIII